MEIIKASIITAKNYNKFLIKHLKNIRMHASLKDQSKLA